MCSNLVVIRKLILKKSLTYSTWFNGCGALEQITVEGEIGRDISFSGCRNLNDSSIQNIIDTLADLTGETSRTITWHSTVLQKLTENQYSQILAKNWGCG